MTVVKFYDDIEDLEDLLLKVAVIVSKSQNQYVFYKHKERDT